MEILFITHKYPPSIGGMEKQSYELIYGTSKKYKVHKLVYDNKSSKLIFLLTLHSQIKRILKENPNISIIHLNDGLMVFFAFAIRKITTISIIATIHGLDIVFPNKLYQKIMIKRFKKLDGIIAVSQATANECIKRGFCKENVFVVKNGVDTTLSDININTNYISNLGKKLNVNLQNKKLLVSIGRSVKRKGFSWFLNNILPKLEKNVVYLIIGPQQKRIKILHFILKLLPNNLSHQICLLLGLGIDEYAIQQALKKPELKNRAFYLGKLPFEDMIQILYSSDIYIMPNIKVNGDAEGFGLVAIEASICGLTVLASDLEGIKDAISNEANGFLLPPENETVWIQKIESLLKDKNLLNTFGEGAKKYTLENYSLEKMVNGYIHIFRKFIDTPKSIEKKI
jgi:phosphatidylinositol alpha-1,6-mannosyltransferase